MSSPAPAESVPAAGAAVAAARNTAAMRRVYGQGWGRTGVKLAALSCAYVLLGGFMLAATAVYAFLAS
jgi:hypothetical protein